MATRKPSPQGKSNFAEQAKRHDEAHAKNLKDLAGAEASKAKQVNDEIMKVARELMARSKTFTLKGLVESTVGETLKDVKEIQERYNQQHKKLTQELAKKQRINAANSSEALTKEIARLEKRMSDMTEDFHNDMKDARHDLDKAQNNFLSEETQVGKLNATRVGKLLEKQARKSRVSELMERRKEFLANRKDLMHGLNNQLKIAKATDNTRLAMLIQRQLDAAEKRDFVKYDRMAELVESGISAIDSRFTRNAIVQAAELKSLRLNMSRGAWALAGKAGRFGLGVTSSASNRILGHRATKIIGGTIGAGISVGRGVRSLSRFIDNQYQSHKIKNDILNSQGTEELDRMADSENKREEINELRRIARAIDGGSGSGGLLAALAGLAALLHAGDAGKDTLAKIVGGAEGIKNLERYMRDKFKDKPGSDKPTGDRPPKPPDENTDEGRQGNKISDDFRTSEDIKRGNVVSMDDYNAAKDSESYSQGKGLPNADYDESSGGRVGIPAALGDVDGAAQSGRLSRVLNSMRGFNVPGPVLTAAKWAGHGAEALQILYGGYNSYQAQKLYENKKITKYERDKLFAMNAGRAAGGIVGGRVLGSAGATAGFFAGGVGALAGGAAGGYAGMKYGSDAGYYLGGAAYDISNNNLPDNPLGNSKLAKNASKALVVAASTDPGDPNSPSFDASWAAAEAGKARRAQAAKLAAVKTLPTKGKTAVNTATIPTFDYLDTSYFGTNVGAFQ